MISPFVKQSNRRVASTAGSRAEPATGSRALGKRTPLSYWRGAGSPSDQRATVAVSGEYDVVCARQLGREIAARAGFAPGDQTVIAAAIAEVARNIVSYAGSGEIVLIAETSGGRPGIVVVARDQGPGIPDVSCALREGFSTAGGPGLGLSGARRLMDMFEIVSAPGKGTTITMQKWRRNAS